MWVEPVLPTLQISVVYKTDDFQQRCLRVTDSGRYVWMRSLKATEEFYGWNNQFPTLLEAKLKDSLTGYIKDPGRRTGNYQGGRTLYISRSPVMRGFPKNLTNAFRVSLSATQLDLVAIAQSTQVNWEWMTDLRGRRRPRSWWLQFSLPATSPPRSAQAAA